GLTSSVSVGGGRAAARPATFEPSHPSRDGTGEQATHHLVPGVGGGAEHQRATAVEDRDPVLPAVLGGGGRDAAGTEQPVHPDVLYAELDALVHGRLGG